MAASNWRAGLAFSTRLAAITNLTAAYQTCHPAALPTAARFEATRAEIEAFNAAASLLEYEQLCEDKLRSLSPHTVEFPQEEDDEYVPTPDAKTIGKYDSATYYREGLFSAIYKAPALGDCGFFPQEARSKVVALKVTTPSMMEPPHDAHREAKILQLAACKHVIPLLETYRTGDGHFVLVFPFVRYDLNDLMYHDALSRPQVKACLRSLFSGLAYIHSKGIIHRDIKPSNMLVKSRDGPAYLTDFGIAWAANVPGAEPPDAKMTDVGTTCYRPPELLFGNQQYGCSLDLWAAGCTVAEMLDPEHDTLFDSGELGSDLALVQSIFTKLGTPTLQVWPEAKNLPDWGKVQFHEYPAQEWSALLPELTMSERDLVESLVRYESGTRLTAEKVLEHPYFACE